MHSPVSSDKKHIPTEVAMPRPEYYHRLSDMYEPSVTAAMTLVSLPAVEVAVLGRAVRGRPAP
jgi:hypothetical protein